MTTAARPADRRGRLVDSAIDLVAAHGYTGCSLQRIADAEGITKAAVIYHFATKSAVLQAAYERVIDGMVAHVGAAVDDAPTPVAAVDAYLSSMVGYFAANPGHVRLISETLDHDDEVGTGDAPTSPGRWQPLADLLEAAGPSVGRPGVGSRELAIILGGGIDALLAERERDAGFDIEAATRALSALLR